jgi:Mrp family chromosome partitioning ATPase
MLGRGEQRQRSAPGQLPQVLRAWARSASFGVGFLALFRSFSQIMLAFSIRHAIGRWSWRNTPGRWEGEPVTVILAIANNNGGVGKTVTAANVSAGFARAGRRTLAVDCDAQADLTRWLLGRADQDVADLEAIVAGGADPAAAVHPTRVAGRLRPRYDAMVLDLPSSLSRLTVSAREIAGRFRKAEGSC